jgi:putative hydrolase of the HAD superfamily
MGKDTDIQVLLFDLGGVLIDIDFERVVRHWARYSRYPLTTVRDRCVLDEPYFRYERGETSDAEFFDHVRVRLGLEASDEEILEGWNAVFVGLNATVMPLVRRAAERLPSFAFTNTCSSHQATWTVLYPDIGQLFRRVFSSAEMGLRKPERDAFDAVVAGIGVDPGAILFFDDMAQNVEGARAAGLKAVQVTGPSDVRRELAALELV